MPNLSFIKLADKASCGITTRRQQTFNLFCRSLIKGFSETPVLFHLLPVYASARMFLKAYFNIVRITINERLYPVEDICLSMRKILYLRIEVTKINEQIIFRVYLIFFHEFETAQYLLPSP